MPCPSRFHLATPLSLISFFHICSVPVHLPASSSEDFLSFLHQLHESGLVIYLFQKAASLTFHSDGKLDIILSIVLPVPSKVLFFVLFQ